MTVKGYWVSELVFFTVSFAADDDDVLFLYVELHAVNVRTAAAINAIPKVFLFIRPSFPRLINTESLPAGHPSK